MVNEIKMHNPHIEKGNRVVLVEKKTRFSIDSTSTLKKGAKIKHFGTILFLNG